MNEIIEKESIKVENVNTLKDYNLRILGNTEQDGTPTPENPVNIRVVTGEQNVEVCGKNLLPPDNNTSTTIDGVTFTRNSDGSVLVNGTATANTQYIISKNFMLEDGKTYILSGCPNGGSFSTYMLNINQYYNNTSHILNNTGYDKEFTYALDSKNSNSIYIYIVSGTKCDNLLFKPMVSINGGDYEPARRQDFPISLGSLELCKIGDYQDYIYKKDNKWWKHKEIGKANNPKMYYIRTYINVQEIEMISDQFSNIRNGQNYIINISKKTETRVNRLVFRMSTALVSGSTEKEIAQNAATYINSKNIIAYYILNTPIDEQITDSKLISQLNNLNNAILYSGENNIITTISPLIDGEGTSINLTPTIKSNIYDIKLKGNTAQNGTPTPENPVDINVVSGSNVISTSNKNLLDISNLNTQTQNGVTITKNKDNSITLNGTSTSAILIDVPINEITLKENTTYVFSKSTNMDYAFYAISLREGNSVYIDMTSLDSSVKSLNINLNTKKIAKYFRLYIPNGKTFTNHTFYPMLEVGSTATTYEPYQGNTYPLSLGNMELCKIGDYQDYIYKKDNKWYKHKVISKRICYPMGVASKLEGTTKAYLFGSLNDALISNSFYREKGFCDISYNNMMGRMYGEKDAYGWNIEKDDNVNNNFNIRFDKKKFPNLDTIKNYFKDKGVTFYYILATPTEEEITDTTLITQLNNLSKATTYAGETNIVATSDGNNLPVTNYIKAYSSEIINESYPYLDLKYNLPYTEKLENLDFYLNENGRLVIKNVGTYLCSISESEIPDMPEASETTVKIAGRDGDLVLATTYNPIQFSIVIYTDENLSPAEKTEERQKIYKFFHEMKNTFKTFGIEAASKFYRVKYAGDVECENHPKHLKFTLPFKSSVSYGYNFKDKELIGNNIAISNTIEPVGFKCIINGPATNPTISLNNNEMKYEASIVNNEKIIIDTNNSTVTSITDNNESNAIVHYNRVFPKIQNGKNELKILSGIDNPTQVKIEWNDYNL